MHIPSHRLVTCTCAPRMFVACSVLGNETHALQMHHWAPITAAGLLSRKGHQSMCFLPWKDPFWGSFLTVRQVVAAVSNLPLFLCCLSGLLCWPQAGEQANGNYYLMQSKWVQHSHSGVQGFCTPLSIRMKQAIGMAQSPDSGNQLLVLHLQSLRCCGCGWSHRIIMGRYIDSTEKTDVLRYLPLPGEDLPYVNGEQKETESWAFPTLRKYFFK